MLKIKIFKGTKIFFKILKFWEVKHGLHAIRWNKCLDSEKQYVYMSNNIYQGQKPNKKFSDKGVKKRPNWWLQPNIFKTLNSCNAMLKTT